MTQLPLTGAGPSAAGYIAKVKSYNPIAYWPLNELTGSTAICQINTAQNGTYTGVTLGQSVTDASGVTFVCPLFDGTNDFVDIYSATLGGAFDGDEGTLMIWARVFNVGVWTDSTKRFAVQTPYGSGQNVINLIKHNNNNSLRWLREANNDLDSLVNAGYSTTDWFHFAITWSVVADENVYYYNGSETGSDSTIGAWNTALFSTTANNIGASSQVPASPWYGWLAHGALFTSPLTGPQIADLAVT